MRPTIDEYFMEILYSVRKRGTCDRGQTACVLTNEDHQIIATGYAGSIAGAPHCDDVGHMIVNGSCIRTLHAEANAVAQCAKNGIPVKGATAYCFLFPCLLCAKLMIQVGIIRIVAEYDYQKSNISKQFLTDAGVKWQINNDKVYEYID